MMKTRNPPCRTRLASLALASVLAGAVTSSPAAAAELVMKFGTATINETQHQFIKMYKEAL
jgi:TRAP-type C4-dicarboxylate transport system substrate-binding protein